MYQYNVVHNVVKANITTYKNGNVKTQQCPTRTFFFGGGQVGKLIPFLYLLKSICLIITIITGIERELYIYIHIIHIVSVIIQLLCVFLL